MKTYTYQTLIFKRIIYGSEQHPEGPEEFKSELQNKISEDNHCP